MLWVHDAHFCTERETFMWSHELIIRQVPQEVCSIKSKGSQQYKMYANMLGLLLKNIQPLWFSEPIACAY